MTHEARSIYRVRYSTPEKPDGVFYTGAENAVSARLNFLMQTNNPRRVKTSDLVGGSHRL